MYERFFNLTETPFRMTPDTRYFYPSEKHQDALNYMVYTIEERRGFVVITGEIGSGKTTLSRVLFQKLDPRTKTAIIRNTHLTAKDLIALILEELEIPYTPSTSKTQMIGLLNEFLIDQLREDNNVVLLIDEAQNLKPSVLEEVRMLSNLETETEKLIQIILMGQPELQEKLWLRGLTQLRQRVTLHYHLGPLNLKEMTSYIAHRMQVAGANGSPPIFKPDAVVQIYQQTKGVPRLVNSLCDRALLTGYVQDTKRINAAIINEVAGELPALRGKPKQMVAAADAGHR